MTVSLSTETTPLVDDSSVDDECDRGSASVKQTVTNMIKTCMGTGVLALPYAACEGGIVLTIVGTFAVAAWNLYGVKKICQCMDIVQDKSIPSEHVVSSKMGAIGWHAYGRIGLWTADFLLLTLFLGAIVAYEDAIISFARDTPFTSGSDIVNTVVTACIIASLSIVPDMGYLSKASSLGLTVLLIALLVVAGYALTDSNDNDVVHEKENFWLPRQGILGVSRLFGCISYGFGLVPLVFHFRDSMAEPSKLFPAMVNAHLTVSVCNILIGVGLLLLYRKVVDGDIIRELPNEGIFPIVTRSAMAVVYFMTAPLLVVPSGEMIEARFSSDQHDPRRTQIAVRLGVCLLCGIVSVLVPGFVNVVSFVGCWSLSLICFCAPPLFYLKLTRVRVLGGRVSVVFDFAMLVWGVTATVISTFMLVETIFLK